MNQRLHGIASALLLGLAPASAGQSAGLHLEPRIERVGGRSVQLEVGTLEVPLRHGRPESGRLRLAVAVRRSTSSAPGAPIVFLNGIPDSATRSAADEEWDPFLELGDLVLLDQRGAGRSEPALVWSRPPYRPQALFADRETALANLRATAEVVRAFTDGVGVELAAFNTRESARDVELLRRALGAERIRLVGHSGGTHLGFEVLRQCAAHVERFVSLGTAGPDDIHSLPSELDDALREVARLAAQDERIGESMPDLYGRVQAALLRLDESPLPLQVTLDDGGEPVEVVVGRHGLQFLLALELGDPEDMALLPRLVHELEQGRSDVLRWFVERRFRVLDGLPVLLFVNRSASGATAQRWARIRSEAQESPFGTVRCLFSPELDSVWGVEDLGDAFRAPLESAVPTLFVSATLDGKTPPARAERARAGFARSVHVTLVHGGHNDLLADRDVRERVLAFLAGDELEDERIERPAPRFALLEGRDPLLRHPALP